MRIAKWIWGVALGSVLALACSSGSSTGGGTGTCANVDGQWALSGTCPDTSCTITQNGCNISVSCSPSGDYYTGSVTDSGISFGDSSGSCSGSVSGKNANGNCNDPTTGTCSWQASCTSGTCGTPSGTGGGGGGGGSGGTSSGIDCNSACSALTACCTLMDMTSCLQGCNGNPGSASCEGCFQNAACGSLVPCVINFCDVPQEACPSG